MTKSRGNVVNPDDIVRDYGADASGSTRCTWARWKRRSPGTRATSTACPIPQRVWRNLIGDEDDGTSQGQTSSMQRFPKRSIASCTGRSRKSAKTSKALRFNTAIAELIKLNNEMTGMRPGAARAGGEVRADARAVRAAPGRGNLGAPGPYASRCARRPWPTYDPAKLVESTMELPVQVNGKLRDKITVPADADEETILKTAENAEKVKVWLNGKVLRKRLYVAGKLVNLVVG